MVSGCHLEVVFSYLFISSLLKNKSGQASSLTEAHCVREEKVVMISKALRKTTCQLPQNATGLSVVTFFFSCQQPFADSLTKSRSCPQLSEEINPSATDTEHLSWWKKFFVDGHIKTTWIHFRELAFSIVVYFYIQSFL